MILERGVEVDHTMIYRWVLAYAPELDKRIRPHRQDDFNIECSCSDWSNPCKHIAGVHYLLAAQLDQDPFLLFELRGLSREALQKKPAKSPLGQALSAEMTLETTAPKADSSYFTKPTVQTAVAVDSSKDFWQLILHQPIWNLAETVPFSVEYP